jgi:hypothetical protein
MIKRAKQLAKDQGIMMSIPNQVKLWTKFLLKL